MDTFRITFDEAENVLRYYRGNMESTVQFLTHQLKPFSAASYSAVTYGPENRKGTYYFIKLVTKYFRVGWYVVPILEAACVKEMRYS